MNDSTNNRPFGVYVVEDIGNGKSFWTRVGAAFPHKSRDSGLTVTLTAIPLSGKLVICPPRPEREAGQ